jgi:hypothetical protein
MLEAPGDAPRGETATVPGMQDILPLRAASGPGRVG